MYAMNIQNDVIGLVLRENCKSKQVTDFIAWPSRCHVRIITILKKNSIKIIIFLFNISFYFTNCWGAAVVVIICSLDLQLPVQSVPNMRQATCLKDEVIKFQ
jgi:hypothetical protein